MSAEKSPADFADLSHKEQVFAFLSLIHPRGETGAQDVFDDYDLLEAREEQGNPDKWLFNLYMYDDMDVEGECVLYTLFSDYIDADKEDDDSEHIIDSMTRMATARDCEIDWGTDVNNRSVRLTLGMTGLLATAARSLHAQGFTLWRDTSPDSMRHPDGFEEYSGWMTKSADDERLLALCALLKIPVQRCDEEAGA